MLTVEFKVKDLRCNALLHCLRLSLGTLSLSLLRAQWWSTGGPTYGFSGGSGSSPDLRLRAAGLSVLVCTTRWECGYS